LDLDEIIQKFIVSRPFFSEDDKKVFSRMCEKKFGIEGELIEERLKRFKKEDQK
jgi:hypothetical protein